MQPERQPRRIEDILEDSHEADGELLLKQAGIGSGAELLARLRGPPPGNDDVDARVARLSTTLGRVGAGIAQATSVKDKLAARRGTASKPPRKT